MARQENTLNKVSIQMDTIKNEDLSLSWSDKFFHSLSEKCCNGVS